MPEKEFIVNQKREFGNIISDAFVFVKRTFKIQFELFLILVLPVLLIAIYNFYFLFSDLDFFGLESEKNPFVLFSPLKVILSYGGTLFSYLIFSYIIYAVAIKYEENDNQRPAKDQVIDFLKENAGKYFSYFLTIIFSILVFGLVSFGMLTISPGFGVLLVLLLMMAILYIVPYLSIFPVLYLKEDKNLVDSVSDTFRLIKGQWWPTFGVIVVTNIIASFATYILIIPIYVIMMVKMFSSVDNPADTGDQFGFWVALLLIVSIISGIMVLTYSISATTLKFYDLKERKDNGGLLEKIDKIGDNESSIFENEGEF